MPVNFPYDYGDELTVEEAKTNLKNHAKDILSVLPVLILTLGSSAVAADGSSANDGLKKSMENKATKQSPIVGLPQPTSQTGRVINTGLLCAGIGVICQNAMWTGNPALILGCAAVTVGFMFPDMLKYLKK